jgi:hypothetical protein
MYKNFQIDVARDFKLKKKKCNSLSFLPLTVYHVSLNYFLGLFVWLFSTSLLIDCYMINVTLYSLGSTLGVML